MSELAAGATFRSGLAVSTSRSRSAHPRRADFRWVLHRLGAVRCPREPLPLTDREREIVMLLGEGLSNCDVAARLTLSVRTVEGHIYKAMTKTGTASREESQRCFPNASRRPTRNPTFAPRRWHPQLHQ